MPIYCRGFIHELPKSIRSQVKSALKENPILAEHTNYYIYFSYYCPEDMQAEFEMSSFSNIPLYTGVCYCLDVIDQ